MAVFAGFRRTQQTVLAGDSASIRARLDYELGRARRYGGNVSVVSVKDASNGASNGEWHRFSSDVAGTLRDLDIHWVESDRILLVLPETDAIGRAHVLARILDRAHHEGLAVEAMASTFPDDAPTSDALLRSVSGGQEA